MRCRNTLSVLIMATLLLSASACRFWDNSKTSVEELPQNSEIQTSSLVPDGNRERSSSLVKKYGEMDNFTYEYSIRYETPESSDNPDNSLKEARYRVWYINGGLKTQYDVSGSALLYYISSPGADHFYMYYPQENTAVRFPLNSESGADIPMRKYTLNPVADIKNNIRSMVNNGTSVVNGVTCDVFNHTSAEMKTTYYFSQDTGFPIRMESRSENPAQPLKYTMDFKNFRLGAAVDSDIRLPAGAEVISLEEKADK